MTARGLAIADTRFERCTFDNARAHGGLVQRVELVDCAAWACSLRDLTLEDCSITDVRTSRPGGGRTTPLFLWGVLATRVVLRGTVGGIVWNPPAAARTGTTAAAPFDAARRHYDAVGWALDIREARFRSVPSFRFGPPGRLVRRDPLLQPRVTFERAAEGAWRAIGPELGIWETVINGLLSRTWPDDVVLIPAAAGPRPRYERQLRGIQRLREAGVLAED